MKVNRGERVLNIELRSELETDRLGRAISRVAQPSTVIALVGTLGAGKTRLSRAIAEALGVQPQAIASPTFVLIHEYDGRLPVYHFDTYRLSSPAEFEAIGALDYFEAGGVCLVEWADRVPELMPADAWWIRLEHHENDPDSRQIEIKAAPHVLNALVDTLESSPPDSTDDIGPARGR